MQETSEPGEAPGNAEPDRDELDGNDETSSPVATKRPARKLSWQRLTIVPVMLVVLLLATWLWFQQADLDPVSENALSNGQVSQALWEQVELTAISTFFVLIIAIPLGILLTRRAFRKATPVAMALANMGQATPRSVFSPCW